MELMADSTENHIFYQAWKKPPLVDRAEGVRLWDKQGKEYIDACSGAVAANIGYGNRDVIEAIKEQAEQTFFAYRMHFENQAALDLAKGLVEQSAPHLNKVFFVSGGSEAVETAMKLCRQYYYDRGEGSRHIFISRTPSYHGCTLGALALTSYAILEAPFQPLIKKYPKIPAPYCYRCHWGLTHPECGLRCAHDLDRVIREVGPKNIAGFVAEPIGGASTGALVPPEEYFDIIQDICRRHGVMLILDEVMTGFGRTGTMFAYQHWNVEADIVALSKGMAAGHYPLGAVIARESIVDAVLDSGGFMHGHTYAGNPMACAVGRAVLKVVVEQDLPGNARAMGPVLSEGLHALADKYPIIGQVRGRGLLQAIELVADRGSRRPLPAEATAAQLLTDVGFENGVILYPRRSINSLEGDHVLVAPPLIIDRPDITELLARVDKALARVSAKLGVTGG